MILVLLFDRDGRLVDTACSRRYHASIKSRQTSPTGDERQNKRKSSPSPADSLNESQLAARSGPSPRRRTTPTAESKQQASMRQRGYARFGASPGAATFPTGLAVQLRGVRRGFVRGHGAPSPDAARAHRDGDNDAHDHGVVP